jgi:hypothetical protein
MTPPQRRRLQLVNSLTAVKLSEHPGSRLRNPTETLLVIPIGAIVETEGAASRELITILWNGDAYSVFHEDLEKSAKDTGPAGGFD